MDVLLLGKNTVPELLIIYAFVKLSDIKGVENGWYWTW